MTRKMKLVAVGLLIAAVSSAALHALNQIPERSTSPLEASRQLEPKAASVAGDTTKPVPELVSRAEMKNLGSAIPASVIGLQHADQQVAPLRNNSKKSPSGLWMLTSYYFGFRTAVIDYYNTPASEAYYQKAFAEWEATSAKSPTPYVMRAIILRRLAIDAIEVVAKSKPPEPQAHLAMQRRVSDLLEFVKTSNPVAENDPGWYMAKISALAVQCAPQEEIWAVLEEGSKKFPDFHQMYFEVVLAGFECNAVDPKNLVDKVISLGIERSKETDGEGMYARTLWYVSNSFTGDGLFTSDWVDWTRMKQGIHDVLKRYPDSWNTNNFAKFACIGQQADLARELFPKVLELPVLEVWGSKEALDGCYAWAMSSVQAQPQHLVP
jgi:hypothetical protein